MTKSPLRLCTVLGDHFDLFPFFLQHYQRLGVKQFDIILHIPEHQSLTKGTALLRRYGLHPVGYLEGVWNGAKNTNAINRYKSQFADDWFIVADSDELQLYPCSLDAMRNQLVDAGEAYATGCLIDRIAACGGLPAVQPVLSLWDQFPYAGFVSFPLMRANPLKIVLCKGRVRLSEGQHGVWSAKASYPVSGTAIVQVHHFKWTHTVLERLRLRQKSIESGHWEHTYKEYGTEIERLIRYLGTSMQRFDLQDASFLLSRAAGTYDAYNEWPLVQSTVSSWSRLQAYPIVNPHVL